MSNLRAFSGYQQTSVVGLSAVGQVVALYERMLRDFRRALEANERGEIEKRVNEANHALQILAELQGSLDFENGGEAAKRFNDFYNVSRMEIFKVCVAPSREGFQRLIDLFTPVCQAWKEVSRKLPASPARETRPEVRIKMSARPAAEGSINDEESQRPVGVWRG